MKRSLLCLSLLLATPTFAGHEGGGGDAIYINDGLVMRDFVAQGQFDTVLDNSSFLKNIPDFNNLINEISEAYPQLALRIVNDLMGTVIYQATSSLPKLPDAVTTLIGPKADVQIAIRWNNDIVLAPEFTSLDTAAYLMVHESLHALLDENSGPLHHHRVRTIVNYLKKNRGNYDSVQLKSLLLKNKFKSDIVPALYNGIFSEEVSEDIRCFYNNHKITGEGFSRLNFGNKLNGYFGDLSCEEDFNTEHYTVTMERYLKQRNILSGNWEENQFAETIKEPSRRLSKVSTSFIDFNKSFLKKVCKENNKKVEEENQIIELMKRNKNWLNEVVEASKTKQITKGEESAILEYMQSHLYLYGNYRDFGVHRTRVRFDKKEDLLSYYDATIEWVEKINKRRLEDQSECKKRYPKL